METTITLDDASRNLARLIARAHERHESVVITDHGRPLARLSPVENPALTGAELAARLESAPRLSPENAEALEREIMEGRARLSPPRPAWD